MYICVCVCRGGNRGISNGLIRGKTEAASHTDDSAESYGVNSKVSDEYDDDNDDEEKKKKELHGGTWWAPHPKTGIYFPKGHDWVMNDVPEGAATFSQTCWFRNDDDGVDNPNL